MIRHKNSSYDKNVLFYLFNNWIGTDEFDNCTERQEERRRLESIDLNNLEAFEDQVVQDLSRFITIDDKYANASLEIKEILTRISKMDNCKIIDHFFDVSLICVSPPDNEPLFAKQLLKLLYKF